MIIFVVIAMMVIGFIWKNITVTYKDDAVYIRIS